jgi:hypothetical protein
MKLDYRIVDVFTAKPYSGNPLAIVLIPAELAYQVTDEQKHKIAREFNLSETVFLYDDVAGVRKLSIWITTGEIVSGSRVESSPPDRVTSPSLATRLWGLPSTSSRKAQRPLRSTSQLA